MKQKFTPVNQQKMNNFFTNQCESMQSKTFENKEPHFYALDNYCDDSDF